MIMKKSSIITLAALIISLILISSSSAQDTLLISYQGRLTDDGGNPVTGTPSMTFAIYDGGSVSKWTETHPTIQVNEGLFNVILGSQTALPDSVFTGEDRYLGITVGGDPEISPRTLFTSAPSAAVAKKVAGDITTGEGEMMLRSSTGADSAIVFSATGIAHLMKINWAIPPDDQRPGLELGSDANSNFMRVNWSVPPDDQVPAFEVLSDGVAESIEMRLSMPPDDIMPEIGFSVDQTVTAFNMNSPTGGLNPDFKIQTTATGGPSMSFFDDVGKVMGVEPSPFNEGFSMRLIDPGDDERGLLEIAGNHVTDEASIHLIDPGDDEKYLSISGIPSTGASIYMFNPQPEPPARALIFQSEQEAGASFKMFNSLMADPLLPEISLEVGLTSNVFTMGFQTQSGDLRPGVELTSDANTASILIGSGPNIASQNLISLLTDNTEARIGIGTDAPSEPLVIGKDVGSYGGNRLVIGDDEAGVSTGLVMGEDDNSRGWFLWNVDDNYLDIGTKEAGTSYGNTMTIRSDQVGIKTTSPNYDLDVRGTIGNNTTLYHSDKRWKRDIQKLNGSLDRVMKLQGVQYKWKQDKYPEMNFPNGEQIGLIAQDVEEVIPEVVDESADGYKSIDYAKLVSVLIESIKEQQEQIKALSKRVEELESIKVSSR